jgi:hypothetical protein
MVQQFWPNFPHRFNADGSYDSICTLCQMTVATAKTEAELYQHERRHECNPDRLYRLSELRPGSHAIALYEWNR